MQECFPYLAKRLLSDDSPRARGALRTLLYGTGDELNLSKLQEMTSGLESYTVSTASVESSRGETDAGRDAALDQLAAVVLAEEGNYVQAGRSSTRPTPSYMRYMRYMRHMRSRRYMC